MDVKIKWPNDLYLNGLKIGGILSTSTYRSKKFNVSVGKYVIFCCFGAYMLTNNLGIPLFIYDTSNASFVPAGIGLNVDNEKPTTCLNSVLRELSPAASILKREHILASFFNKFENFYHLFTTQGDYISVLPKLWT